MSKDMGASQANGLGSSKGPEPSGLVPTGAIPSALLPKLLRALSHDCEETDGWEGAAQTLQAAADRLMILEMRHPSGLDPELKLRAMSHEQLVAECCYRGAELVVARARNALAAKQFSKSLLVAWTEFLDANPDDVNSPDEYPDHALVTFAQVLGIALNAIAAAARQSGDVQQAPSVGPQSGGVAASPKGNRR